MNNKLSNENSPYLLQHADNPVDWYPWGEEALQKARQEDKPIFLSIGYAACHWCHVMAHESFEDPDTAELMNRLFINIKVDREERPDLDSIYMNAVVAMTGQGGWPMSVFLTPEGKPFFGGTYYPPVRRYNMPSFREVLLSVSKAWQENREQILQSGQELTQHIQTETGFLETPGALRQEALEQAAEGLAQSYDHAQGGWGRAPKFPQPMVVEFLLRRAARADLQSLELATHALKAMAKGGMYDVVGGGFARYSTDDQWLVPHFEKMLYDNAQLAKVYLYAYLLTGDPAYRRVCEETLNFTARELRHPQGGFFSSLDADSEGEEGKFYLWDLAEIKEALQEEDFDFLVAAYQISPGGNFEGKTVLQRALDDHTMAERFGMQVSAVPERLKRLHNLLLEVRSHRVRPGTDDKVLVSWNGLMLEAFSEAARYLHRTDYHEIAVQNARFLLDELHTRDRLLRSWREGKARHNAYLEDYAALILGLLSLYQTDLAPDWYNSAIRLAEEMVAHFQDPSGGFFDTRDDHETLVTRPKDLQDNATPSGNALAAEALLKLSAYSGKGEWRDLAENSISSLQKAAARYPTSFARWLNALDFALADVKEVAILDAPGEDNASSLTDVLWATFRPDMVAAVSTYPPAPEGPPLLVDRPLKEGRPTAYVCQNFVCRQPVTTPEELLAQLDA